MASRWAAGRPFPAFSSTWARGHPGPFFLQRRVRGHRLPREPGRGLAQRAVGRSLFQQLTAPEHQEQVALRRPMEVLLGWDR